MIKLLAEAGKLARDYSLYRDLSMSLEIKPDGIEIVGLYPGWRYVELIRWEMLATDHTQLESEMRRMHAQLTERWRDDGMPERKLRDAV